MRIWNDMGAQIDGALLPILAAIYGIDDIETLFAHLIVIRDHQQRKQSNFR